MFDPETRVLRKRARSKIWYEANHVQILAKRAARRKAQHEVVAAAHAKYRAANLDRYRLWNSTRRAGKEKRTPAWLTDFDKRWMGKIYEVAAGLGLTVDHVAPLHGRVVSGLHVPLNLQMLSGPRNSEKGNRYVLDKNVGL